MKNLAESISVICMVCLLQPVTTGAQQAEDLSDEHRAEFQRVYGLTVEAAQANFQGHSTVIDGSTQPGLIPYRAGMKLFLGQFQSGRIEPDIVALSDDDFAKIAVFLVRDEAQSGRSCPASTSTAAR